MSEDFGRWSGARFGPAYAQSGIRDGRGGGGLTRPTSAHHAFVVQSSPPPPPPGMMRQSHE